MLALPDVTLIALTSLDYEGHKIAVDKSSEGIEWGAKKIIWDESIKSIDDWNKAVIFDLWKYVDTPYCMLVHADGYVINPSCWTDEFLEYDYVGSPWPLPTDEYSYRDYYGNIQRVGNSVSLRSWDMLYAPFDMQLPWREYYGNTNEDGYLAVHNRHALEGRGLKFAPLELAVHFGKEAPIPENENLNTFAFHHYG